MCHCFTSEILEKFSFKLISFMNCLHCEKIVTGLSLANQTRLFGVFFFYLFRDSVFQGTVHLLLDCTCGRRSLKVKVGIS